MINVTELWEFIRVVWICGCVVAQVLEKCIRNYKWHGHVLEEINPDYMRHELALLAHYDSIIQLDFFLHNAAREVTKKNSLFIKSPCVKNCSKKVFFLFAIACAIASFNFFFGWLPRVEKNLHNSFNYF